MMRKRFCKYSLMMALSLASLTASAQQLVLSDAWVRAVPPVSGSTAAYFSLRNDSDEKRTLSGASAEFADSAMLHDMSRKPDGQRAMSMLSSVELPPGRTMTFAPGGKHVMLVGLKRVPKEGENVTVCLHFVEVPPLCQPFVVRRQQ